MRKRQKEIERTARGQRGVGVEQLTHFSSDFPRFFIGPWPFVVFPWRPSLRVDMEKRLVLWLCFWNMDSILRPIRFENTFVTLPSFHRVPSRLLSEHRATADNKEKRWHDDEMPRDGSSRGNCVSR